MCPISRRLVNGEGSLFARGALVAHCLLVETDGHGLVLVDTGIGEDDLRDPKGRLGGAFVAITGAGARAPTRTARAQVSALGYDPRDVRHIVCTHLDLDHAGGLADFPEARVHVPAAESSAALARATLPERERYRPAHFAHGPRWAHYEERGEAWFGFPAARALEGLPPEILAVPLPGHTRGHACVAVQHSGRWLLHAGDGFFHRSVVEPDAPSMPAALRLFESLVAVDRARVAGNHARLRALAAEHRGDVDVFCAHDPEQFARLAARA
jgi:glyoxylase-like metal-dependent hydrolase (beta-lactamase superfamily II)